MAWHISEKPLVIMAPMDGYTIPPFRRFIKQIAPGAIVFSEFLSASQVRHKPSLAEKFFEIYPDEQPVVIQLYGKEPEDFRVAAMHAQERGAAGVDINMGCPSKKVVAHRHGSALMREIDLACEIIATMKSAISVPVTVKTRLGWEDERNLIPFAKRLEDHGLDAITVHGRTYSQKFEGKARWEPVYHLKDALSIPVFGNGDIDSPCKAAAMLGNLDGVMIGRAALNEPWLMQRVCALLHENRLIEERPEFKERLPHWRTFAEMATSQGNEFRACCAFRKYLVRLVKELDLDRAVRAQATSVETREDIYRVLDLMNQVAEAQAAVLV